jgi:hypothetical protein
MMQRNNLIVEGSRRAYNDVMRYTNQRSSVSSDLLRSVVHACLTCQNARHVRTQELGFCADCLERARIITTDELGGEC